MRTRKSRYRVREISEIHSFAQEWEGFSRSSAYARKQKEVEKEKLREFESQAELQRKLLKAKEDAEGVRLEAELEAHKTRLLEAEAIRLEVEDQA